MADSDVGQPEKQKFVRLFVTASAVALVAVLVGCGGSESKEAKVCKSVKTSPVLFDEVLLRGKPASNYPEKTLQPAEQIYSRLGTTPDETRFLSGNVLFRWIRYDNTAYLLAALSASAPDPAAHEYVAAKACDWKSTVEKAKNAAKRLGVEPGILGTPADR
jgi:hypothetical protein